MRTLIVGFLIFLCWLFFCRWYYVCQIRNQCGYQTEQVEEDLRAKTLNLVDNGKNVLEGYDQFRFDTNAFNPSLNANNEDFIHAVAAYLKENPGKQMNITGYYLPSEVDSTKQTKYGKYFVENIGLARAAATRQLLVDAGIDEGRMKLNHSLLKKGDMNSSPISFSCYGDSKLADGGNGEGEGDGKGGEGTPDEYDTGGQDFSFTNMSFSDANFKYDSDIFEPGTAFKSYADSVKTYLTIETDKSLRLVGHTCDLGSESYNKELGLRRAKSVKKYFEGLGVKTSISTVSEGEDKPAYKDKSQFSRSKNRRVVVQIK